MKLHNSYSNPYKSMTQHHLRSHRQSVSAVLWWKKKKQNIQFCGLEFAEGIF